MDKGPPDLKRLLSNPYVIGAALVAVVLGVFIWRKTNNAAGASRTAGVMQPGQTANAESADQFGLAVGQMQQELSNLIEQWSAGIAGLQNPPGGIPPGGYTAPTNSPIPPSAPVPGHIGQGGGGLGLTGPLPPITSGPWATVSYTTTPPPVPARTGA